MLQAVFFPYSRVAQNHFASSAVNEKASACHTGTKCIEGIAYGDNQGTCPLKESLPQLQELLGVELEK